jgi:hypothetical protein
MKLTFSQLVALALFALGGAQPTFAQAAPGDDLGEIKQILTEQERTIRALKDRVAELEAELTPPVAAAADPSGEEADRAEADEDSASVEEVEAVEEQIRLGRRAPVIYRHTMNDRQAAAARAGDYTLDPTYRGFIPIPNTAIMMKINAKPRVDFIGDTGDPGTDFRFVPAKFPTSNENGWQFGANANGSQLILDVQAPSVKGTPRVYYQSDFFGSNDSHMNYRLQHLYGEVGGFLTGFTFGVFEDPDAWPNTVDYEGPNSVIFARRAVVQYRTIISEGWELTLSLEGPDISVDPTGDDNASDRSRAPDGGFALRWAPGDLGHVRMAAIVRSIGVNGGGGSPTGNNFDDDDVIGWGINTSGNLHLSDRDNVQFWFVYGEGIGGMGNDTSFLNSDAAFKSSGNLEALEYWSTMVAVTHDWAPRWSSTMTHGYVNLDTTDAQAPNFYNTSHYASANLVYQMFTRMRVGIEGLYGRVKVKSGTENDIFRIQAGISFAIFD